MSSIFLSHSSKDNAIAEQVKARLTEWGHRSIFLDFDPADGIPAGREWEKELYARLEECRAVILLCSQSSMESCWCFAEITQAKALGKPLFPIRIDACKVGSLLTNLQIIDATADWDEAYQRLSNGLLEAGLDPKDIFDWDKTRSPYPGLFTFQEQDAAIFFGRDKEIGAGLDLLRERQSFPGPRLVMALGASGSGKSSLVRAGLLPRLKRDTRTWLIIDPFRPQHDPFEELSRAIAESFRRFSKEDEKTNWEKILEKLKADCKKIQEKINHPTGGTVNVYPTHFLKLIDELREAAGNREATVLLTIDQFEELFLYDVNHPASRFLPFLRAVVDNAERRFIALATLRSDFLGTYQEHPVTRDLKFKDLKVGPMPVEGLAQVIMGPARVANIHLEDGLVQAMVDDTKTADALPLLAFTLGTLYKKYGKDNRSLTVEEYRGLGGLQGSIKRAAEDVYQEKLPSHKEKSEKYENDLRVAFLAMVRVNAGKYVKQPAQWEDLPADTHEVLEQFVQARLLVSSSDKKDRLLEVAHEALFRAWPRLEKWLDDNEVFLLWRGRFEERSKEWEEKSFNDDLLLRLGPLAEAEGWLDKHRVNLTPGQQKFLQVSRARLERENALEKERQDRERRRQRVVTFVSVIAALVFLIVAAVAGLQWINAKEQLATNYWSQAISAKKGDDRLRAAHFSAKAGKELGPVLTYVSLISKFGIRQQKASEVLSQFSASLLNVHVDSEILLGHVLQHQGPIFGVTFSQDEQRILTWSGDGTARLWQAKDGAPVGAADET